ncbi:MAG: hypothetical protein E3J72_14510 [Planctomycetota bacterium]|nr:MAG: hypothetical protein E3J72_14510 [Planctomycetota bacterium]
MLRILLLFLALFAIASFPVMVSGCTGRSDYDPYEEDDVDDYSDYSSSSSPSSSGSPMPGAGVGISPGGGTPTAGSGAVRLADGRVMSGADRGGQLNRTDYEHYRKGSIALGQGLKIYKRYFQMKGDGAEVDPAMAHRGVAKLKEALTAFEKIRSVRGSMKEQIEDEKSKAAHWISDLLRE